MTAPRPWSEHVAPGVAVPLHPEAAAFAEHYGFVIDVLAAYRPTGKGRVERQVLIVRNHVIAGRQFDSIAEARGTRAISPLASVEACGPPNDAMLLA